MHELSNPFLKLAEEVAETKESSEQLLELLASAEQLHPESAEVLAQISKILYIHGLTTQKGRFLLLALDKLSSAEESNPSFFESHSEWLHLWGNIFVQLSQLIEESSFLQCALQKYEKAAAVTTDPSPELYWDWARAWALLGKHSGEIIDLQKGIEKFIEAHQLGCASPSFQIDYAELLVFYGELKGSLQIVEEGIALLKEVIDSTNYKETEGYVRAWSALSLALKSRFKLTHLPQDFDEVNKVFQEAILVAPKEAHLWLDWGELYLNTGWLRRNIKLVEMGLEKLTSSKIQECDPLRVSALLGKGLILLGLYLEDLKLIYDGQQRVSAALEIAPEHPQLVYVSGLVHLALGLYFSDEKKYLKAIEIFEKAIELDAKAMENWHALFQTYLACGIKQENPSLIRNGLKAMERLCSLCPHSFFHLNQWGVGLLRLRHAESDQERQCVCVEEAILKFKQSLALHEDEETIYNLGCAYDLLGDLTGDEEAYEKAIEILTLVFEKKPTAQHIRYHLGLALSHLGELSTNIDCLNQAVELLEPIAKVDIEDETVWCDLGYTLLNLAELVFDSAHSQRGELLRSEAEKTLMRAAELGNGDACYHLACLYSLSGLYERSLHFLKRAEEKECLPSLVDLEHDEWLEGVRKTEYYQQFLRKNHG